MGNNNSNVPHIVSIILEVFARSVIDHTSELGVKLIGFIKFVNVSFLTANFELHLILYFFCRLTTA